MKKRILALLISSLIFMTSCFGGAAGGEETTLDIADTTDMQTEADTTAPPPPEKYSASFVGCGDNIIYYGTWRDAASQSDGTRDYNFKPIYKNVESIISAQDIAFINQETICAQSFELSTYPGFNSPVDLTYDLSEIGFDVVSLANNHMLDKGALGLREAYDNWNDRGMCVIGAYEEKDEGRYITYYEKNGITIAFVAYTEFVNLYEDPANEGLYGPFMKHCDVAGDVREAYENSDFVIVSVHWGEEGSFVPSELQREYAEIMAENGADVILGHHPHVLQPIEWLEGRDGAKTLCAFSLGNFVHEQNWDYNVPGGMLTFNIEKTGDERAVAVSPAFIPTVCHYPRSFYNNVVYLLEDYTEALASEHAVRTYYNHTISLERLKKYVTDTISPEFLPDYLK
ncbi:MAG: CapA family protein [Ruminococcaceae bacterium]|nr:CapA family protein [Oscillospiraceae bacterium]